MSHSNKHLAQLSQARAKSNVCEKNDPGTGCLYVVATPIGNLSDMTFRAIETLQNADVIACEDTRTSRKLTSHYAIKTPLISYHQHNAAMRDEAFIAQLNQGQSIALISDAGTPVISDPGHSLIEKAHDAGITVCPIPGACAVISTVSVAAIGAGDFYMAGFLPVKGKARKTALRQLAEMRTSIVLYEAPHRLHRSLSDLQEAMGERQVMVAREITKMHESFYRGSLSGIIAQFEGKKIKGEIVIMLGPPQETSATISIESDEVTDRLTQALNELPAAKAAAKIAQETGLDKKALYAKATQLKTTQNAQ